MKKTALFLTRIVFSLGIVVILLLKTDVENLVRTMFNANYWYFVLPFLVSFVIIYLGALRWQILLKRFTRNVFFSDLFRFVCISLFYNCFIPGGFAGDIIRGYKCKNHDLNRSEGIASVFVDRIIGLVTFTIFGFIAMLFTYNLIGQTNILFLVLITMISIIVGLYILFNRRMMSCFKTFSNLYPAIYIKVKQFYDYVYYYKDYRGILVHSLIISFLTTFLNILTIYLISVSIGSDVPFIYFLSFVPIITIISYIPISYSGLGIRDAGFILLFVQVGMTRDQALGISLMYFCLLLLLGIMGGIIYILTKPVIFEISEA